MKAYGRLSEQIETPENFEEGEECASRRKRRRKEVRDFRANRPENLNHLLTMYRDMTYRPSPYTYKTIYEPKERFLSMLPYPDHVFDWAILIPTEPILNRTMFERSYACVKGRGQHLMVETISSDIRNNAGLMYYANLDVSKMYASVPLWLPKRNLRRKIKDPKLLHHFDTIIDSSIGTPMGRSDGTEHAGVPIGLKISTIIANMSLCYLDHDCKVCFRLSEQPALADVFAGQYVSEKLLTARTEDDARELAKGVEYLNAKFRRYLAEGVQFYYRFMDNIVVLHEDKTFLHLLVEWIGWYMAAELHLTMNPKWVASSMG